MNKWDELDVEKIEPMEMTQLEKKRIEQHVKQQAPKKRRVGKVGVLVASAAIAGFSLVGASFASPTVASQLPFMENIVSYFADTDASHEAKSHHGKALYAKAETKDATIFVDRAVFDGKTATIYYGIELAKPTDATSVDILSSPHAKGSLGQSGTGYIERIDDRHFVGVDTVTLLDDPNKNEETISLKWKIDELGLYNEALDRTDTIKGKWRLSFDVQAEEAMTTPLTEVSEQSGVTVQLQALDQTAVSTTLTYFTKTTEEAAAKGEPMKGVSYDVFGNEKPLEELAPVEPILHISDDLGNEYTIDAGGGTSDGDGPMYHIATFEPLDPKATTLTIEPYIHEWDEKMKPITIDLTKIK